jgi:hypothetical protein
MAMALTQPPAPRTIHPPAAPGPLDNPLKGWCPYTDAGSIRQPYSMVFLYVPWSELEPHEGDFRFEEWEHRAWNVAAAQGKHVVFRVYIDYPGRPSGMPAWLEERGIRMTPYTDYGGGRSPDYDDPRMVAAMVRLIAALGARYDPNPRVAFVEFGLLGFWGEWHTYPRTTLFASPATQQRVLAAAQRAFPHKIVMNRYPGGYAGTRPDLGFFDDMFPDDTDGAEDWKFLPTMRRSGRTENWKRATIGGEMTPHAATRLLGPEFATTMKALQTGHFTWIGPYCPAIDRNTQPELQEHSREMVRAMGYQFRLTEIAVPDRIPSGSPLRLTVKGVNEGVAPFYYPWPVRVALLDAAGSVVQSFDTGADPRGWLPGEFRLAVNAPIKAPPGEYSLCLGLIDPWTGQPDVAFANRLPAIHGWTELTRLSVLR